MKAAIAGLGDIAPMHVKSLEVLGVEITAVCDKNDKKDKNDKNEKNVPKNAKFFTDYNEMLTRGGFDVLHICLPHHPHAPVAIAALEKNIHVLCEKPMASTLSDAEKMVSAAQKSKAFLSIIFQNRFSPGAELIKSTLESGELGKPVGGWLRVTWNRDEAYYSNSDWRGKIATEGGGVLINQSIHTFDLMNLFLGNPTFTSASIANRAHPSIEVEDVAEGVIHYGEIGEIPVSFFVNTYHPYNAPASLEIICQNGSAALTGEDATITFQNGKTITAGPDTAMQKELGMKSYWGVSHIKQIQAFYAALKNNQPPTPTAEDALRTQRLISDIYESSKEQLK
jgi:predicted dehydrogenase